MAVGMSQVMPMVKPMGMAVVMAAGRNRTGAGGQSWSSQEWTIPVSLSEKLYSSSLAPSNHLRVRPSRG